jgi:hypothetical protein
MCTVLSVVHVLKNPMASVNALGASGDACKEGNSLEDPRLRNMAGGQWSKEQKLVQIVKMKGSFWKNCGFTKNNVNYLYPEEALLLYEKGHLYVQSEDGTEMTTQELYHTVHTVIPRACYLAYARCKVRPNYEY